MVATSLRDLAAQFRTKLMAAQAERNDRRQTVFDDGEPELA